MSKVILVPIVAVIALVVKALFDVEIAEATQADIVTASGVIIAGVVSLVGIFKDHKKKAVKIHFSKRK